MAAGRAIVTMANMIMIKSAAWIKKNWINKKFKIDKSYRSFFIHLHVRGKTNNSVIEAAILGLILSIL